MKGKKFALPKPNPKEKKIELDRWNIEPAKPKISDGLK